MKIIAIIVFLVTKSQNDHEIDHEIWVLPLLRPSSVTKSCPDPMSVTDGRTDGRTHGRTHAHTSILRRPLHNKPFGQQNLPTPQKKFAPSARNKPESMDFILFLAPLGAPEKKHAFYLSLASFSFIFRAIWTSQMIHFPFKKGYI